MGHKITLFEVYRDGRNFKLYFEHPRTNFFEEPPGEGPSPPPLENDSKFPFFDHMIGVLCVPKNNLIRGRGLFSLVVSVTPLYTLKNTDCTDWCQNLHNIVYF